MARLGRLNKRVIVFAEYGWLNGGENSLLAVLPGLSAKGWQLAFACPSQTELSRHLESADIEQIEWNVRNPDAPRKSQDEIRTEMASLLEQHQPAIVHCNSLSTGRLAGPVTDSMQIPSLGYLRDIIKLSRQAISDLNCLDTIVAVSHATKNFHVDHGLQPEKVQVVYNGIDLEKFAPRDSSGYLHDELGIDRSCRLVLCIGQIGLRKATDVVIQSFVAACEQVPDLHLLLVGMRNSQKQESVEFEKRCHQLGNDSPFASQIHWLGRRSDVDRMFNEASLLLHAARQEPLGRVLLEALASGCPLVATAVGGTAEIVGDCHPEQTICEVDSTEQLSDAAVRILTDEQLRSNIGEQFRENAESRFRDVRCADEIHCIYESLLSKKES